MMRQTLRKFDQKASLREVGRIHSSDDAGAGEWLVTAGRIKHRLREGILLRRNRPIGETDAQIK